MRRVGVVGDGLSGLIAGLGAGSCGVEVAIFGHSEPLGGLASPIDPEATWLFDRIPLFWRRKGRLDNLLNRLKVPMPSRRVPLSRMAFIRDDQRHSLPTVANYFRRSTGELSAEWTTLIKAARAGTENSGVPINTILSDMNAFLNLDYNSIKLFFLPYKFFNNH